MPEQGVQGKKKARTHLADQLDTNTKHKEHNTPQVFFVTVNKDLILNLSFNEHRLEQKWRPWHENT